MTLTEAGTLTAVLPLANFTTNPPAGATPLSVTVPVALRSLRIGPAVRDARSGGVIVSVALCDDFPKLAVMTADELTAVGEVST